MGIMKFWSISNTTTQINLKIKNLRWLFGFTKSEIERGQNMSNQNFSFVYRKALLYKEWRSSLRQIIDARNENKIRNLKQFNHEKFLKISCLSVFISRESSYFISLSSSGMYGIRSSFESIILIVYNFASFFWSSTNSSLSASNLLIMSLSSCIVWSFFIFTILMNLDSLIFYLPQSHHASFYEDSLIAC